MLRRFFRSEPAAAIVLLSAAILAVILANSPLNTRYEDTLHRYVLGLSVQHWINDGLMAIFFLFVGLEIKRELQGGALSTWRRRAIPGIAAAGGMLVPALIFVGINWGKPEFLDGWAIPAATDIAFSIGVLSILGSRVPVVARLLLVSIAIVDDLLAIVVIALFYSSDLSLAWLGASALCVGMLLLLNKSGIHMLLPFLAVGVLLWVSVYNSGLHATLAGVILAMSIPASSPGKHQYSPLQKVEHSIERWVNFAILPLFGLANAGIAFSGLERSDIVGTLPLGIALGLVIGKQVGILGTIWLLVRTGVAPVPGNLPWSQLYAVSVLCGIGFTMSLFIGGLAFTETPELMNAVRIGVIGGSIISATAGYVLMRRAGEIERPEAQGGKAPAPSSI